MTAKKARSSGIAPDLSDAESVKEMVEWFNKHFVDPTNAVPSYTSDRYAWGGPYRAITVLSQRYAAVDKRIIQRAVAQIEKDGILEWAPSRLHIQEEFLTDDSPSDRQRSIHAAHADLQLQIAALEGALLGIRSSIPGIGHNNSPEKIPSSIFSPKDEREIHRALAMLKKQPVQPRVLDAAIAAIKRLEEVAGRVLVRAGKEALEFAKQFKKELIGKLAKGTATIAILAIIERLFGVSEKAAAWLKLIGGSL